MSKLIFGILWLLAAASVLVLAAVPISTEAQLVLVSSSIALMLVIGALGLDGALRYVFIGLSSVVILRYFSWRITSTIPSINNPYDFIPGILLLGAELYSLAMLAMSTFVIIDPVVRPKAPFADADAPTVDVLVPSYNEDAALLAVTLTAARSMDYPAHKLKVFLLDDGGTDARVNSADRALASRSLARRERLQSLCRDLGVTYIARQRNEHAKAGNLNNGLRETHGDLIVVFDADHAPAREFLRETVGYFARDPKLFLVQTPHFFLNPDPIEKNLGTFKNMPSENEMFYSLIQRGLDKWNAAFFCGSAAVLRRTAIESVGGFSGASITEDCETALELHSRGWNSVFVDRPMIAGLQPETFESFIGQRTRWCQGMIQLLLLKNPLFKSGLTLPQRICYLSSILYWLFPLQRLIFIIAPMFFIFFDLKIYIANQQEFIAFTLPYILASLILQNRNFGRLRWPWISDVYEYVQSIYLLRPIFSVVLNPRRPTFNVTLKGQTLESEHLSPIALPQVVVYGLVVFSAAYLAHRYAIEVATRDLLVMVALWTGLNVIMTSLGLGIVCEARERRAAPRVPTQQKAILQTADGSSMAAAFEDISFGGCAIIVPAEGYAIRGSGFLRLVDDHDQPFGSAVAFDVRSRARSGDAVSLGLAFSGATAAIAELTAHLVFADMSALRESRARRNVNPGLIGATVRMLGWTLRQSIRSFAFLAAHRAAAGISTKQPVKREAVG